MVSLTQSPPDDANHIKAFRGNIGFLSDCTIVRAQLLAIHAAIQIAYSKLKLRKNTNCIHILVDDNNAYYYFQEVSG